MSIAGSDVRMIERISRRSAELIRDGISFQSHAPQYFCTTADDVKMQLLGEAMQSARQRAQMLGGHGGFDVGRTIDQQVRPAVGERRREFSGCDDDRRGRVRNVEA